MSAPGNTYPTGTYNFKGARIPLVHTNLNIPKWRELLAEYPKNDIVDKLEFGFPIVTSDQPELEPTLKHYSSSYMYYSWLDKFCKKKVEKSPPKVINVLANKAGEVTIVTNHSDVQHTLLSTCHHLLVVIIGRISV